jgi:hypothetical protein
MDQYANRLTTDADIDAALERASDFDSFPRIVEAIYRPEAGLQLLMLRLDDGHRMLIPREELSELKDVTDAQAAEIVILPQGRGIWWPQIDDGLYLPEFLESRWRNEWNPQQKWVAA